MVNGVMLQQFACIQVAHRPHTEGLGSRAYKAGSISTCECSPTQLAIGPVSFKELEFVSFS